MPNLLARSALATGLFLFVSATVGVAGPGPGDPGSVAADFALQEFPTGQIHTLSEHQGEVVLLFIIGYG